MRLEQLEAGERFETPYNKRRGKVISQSPDACGTVIRWDDDTKNTQISVATEVKRIRS